MPFTLCVFWVGGGVVCLFFLVVCLYVCFFLCFIAVWWGGDGGGGGVVVLRGWVWGGFSAFLQQLRWTNNRPIIRVQNTTCESLTIEVGYTLGQ